MRKRFAEELALQMQLNNNIWLLTGDLGYKLFDDIRDTYPDRFINCGAAETAMMDIAVGLALEGKIPFVYSITSFLLYRPFETLRTYINYENIPVKLVASGRNKDYEHDGISHWSEDASGLLTTMLPNIQTFWPQSKEEISVMLQNMLINEEPSFISLKR